MDTEAIKKWWEENKNDVLFAACLGGTVYSCLRLGYILGRRDGYIKGVCDMWDALIVKGEVKTF